MEANLTKYKVDKIFELELSQEKKLYEKRFEDRYNVLNSNIQLTEKIKELAKQKNSNENVIIWNIFGFLNILEYDLTSVGYSLVFEKKPWQKVYFARQVSLIIYEAFKDLPEILGKYYKALFNEIENARSYINVINEYKKELESLNDNNKLYLQEIRMNVSAHRDQDIDKQLKVIRDIDPYKIIRIMFDFEKILRKITDHIQNYLLHSINIQK